MCIYPHGSRVFMIARTLILLSLAARLTTVSLDISLCYLIETVVCLLLSTSFYLYQSLCKYAWVECMYWFVCITVLLAKQRKLKLMYNSKPHSNNNTSIVNWWIFSTLYGQHM